MTFHNERTTLQRRHEYFVGNLVLRGGFDVFSNLCHFFVERQLTRCVFSGNMTLTIDVIKNTQKSRMEFRWVLHTCDFHGTPAEPLPDDVFFMWHFCSDAESSKYEQQWLISVLYFVHDEYQLRG